ncbi:MAG: hypothetical protein BMS9Abin05_0228 [Rhodothermia bacterium]|nr:MAG: hypothetical protein BMS9Abin05_0228 [Rhodothermia bacterium]
MDAVINGKVIVAGSARSELLASTEPLSFWGGYDQATGEIIDRRHPMSGEIGAGKIIAIPFTRGSSTTTGILIESVRAGVAPAGIITTAPDPYLALASIVADEMYRKSFPVIAVGEETFSRLKSGMEIEITQEGNIRVIDDHGTETEKDE